LGVDDETRAEERVGSVLNDKWTLEHLLGIGGMAAVHRCGVAARGTPPTESTIPTW
jgi:hypothetical protein